MQIFRTQLCAARKEYSEKNIVLDIETTGLSAGRDRVYLIGCAYAEGGSLHSIQWFDDSGVSENDMLNAFLLFIKNYDSIILYNGMKFTIPFLEKRIEVLGIEGGSEVLRRPGLLDIYEAIRPYKKFLALENYRQQTVEEMVHPGRSEHLEGADLVSLYDRYQKSRPITDIHFTFTEGNNPPEEEQNIPDEERQLLLHNQNDLLGIYHMVPLLSLPEVFTSPLRVFKASANRYPGLDGKQKEELVLFAKIQGGIKGGAVRPIIASYDGCYLNVTGDRVTLKIPLYRQEMKYFYANYREYYYLPAEDCAIHKSLAKFVDKDHRQQARPETCYTRKTGSFLPQWDRFRSPFFKTDYKDTRAYFEFTPEMKTDREFFDSYGTYVYRQIIAGYGN